ncbi:MAG TPA: hypothetical protein VF292_00600 [Rhodanobacteraceae bacterium]
MSPRSVRQAPDNGATRPKATAPAAGRLAALRFTRRKESWVAESGGCFYKIPRASEDPLLDLDDPDCIATARREFSDLRFLHALDAAACRPERIDGACVVYPGLGGPDLRTLLLRRGPPAFRIAALQAAMRLLARLHHADASAFPARDYRHGTFLAPTGAVLERMWRRPRTLVVTGFEARNFRYDQPRATWCFFDPHHLWRGCPEEDFARFVVSLLMLRGRRGGPRAWTRFDRGRLLAAYESLAPASLDKPLLNYFLRERLAMRRFHALRSARRLRPVARVFAVAYTRLCYRQLQRALRSRPF